MITGGEWERVGRRCFTEDSHGKQKVKPFKVDLWIFYQENHLNISYL